MNLHVAAMCEFSHLYYGLPFYGTGGVTDAERVGVQAGLELMFECMTTALSGADFVHDTGLCGFCTMLSPELMVLHDEIIGMVKVFMEGVNINDETLALDLIDRVGPGRGYLAEKHTREHFRRFWVPKFLDRTALPPGQTESADPCEERLNRRTREIMETHQPEPLAEDMEREIRKVEESWFKELGLKYEYQKRAEGSR